MSRTERMMKDLVPWLARAKALNEPGEGPIAIAEKLGAPLEVISLMKAAISAGSTNNLPEVYGEGAPMAAFVEDGAPFSAFMAMRAANAFQEVPVDTRIITNAAELNGAVVGEGAAIPVSLPDLTGQTMTPENAAALIVVTDDIARNLTRVGQTFFASLLQKAVGKVVDTRMITTLTEVGTPDLSAAVSTPAAIRSALRQCLSHVRTQAGARLYWVMTADALNLMTGIEDPDPKLDVTGGALMGAPIAMTDALPDGKMALIDAQSVAVDVIGMRTESSRHTTVQMDDAPTQDVTTSTGSTAVSMMQTNSVATKIQLAYAMDSLNDHAMALLQLTES